MSRSRRPAVRKYHDRVAPKYDRIYDDDFWIWHDALTWDYLKPHLPRDLSAPVLDLGCGTGKWGLKLLKSGFRVAFLDISPRMLDQARAKVEEQDGSSRATFIQADLADLSGIPDETFAFAVALGDAVGCTESPARTLRQIRKLMLPAGLLVATFDNRLAAIDYYLEKGDWGGLQEFLKTGRTHWLTKNQDEQFPIVTVMPSDLPKLAERSGFELVEVVGKTVLPMRPHRDQLADPETRRRLASIEKTLSRDPLALARAAHLQVVFRAGVSGD